MAKSSAPWGRGVYAHAAFDNLSPFGSLPAVSFPGVCLLEVQELRVAQIQELERVENRKVVQVGKLELLAVEKKEYPSPVSKPSVAARSRSKTRSGDAECHGKRESRARQNVSKTGFCLTTTSQSMLAHP